MKKGIKLSSEKFNKIILYIAVSKDGYISDKNGGVDWLPQPKNETELEIVGHKHLMSRIDTILMGSNSYKQILGFGEWAWADKQTYVFSSSLASPFDYIKITNENPLDFISGLNSTGKDIWLLGGAKLVQSFDKENLIDEIILTIIPKTLGEGISLGISFDNYKITGEKSLMDGMVQKYYLKNSSLI